MSSPPPSFACPACLEPNPASRLLCQRCGALLEPEQEPLPPSWSPGAPWRWRGPLILLGVAAVGAMAAVVLAAALRSDGRLSPPAPPTGAAAAPSPVQAAPAAVEVDPRSISASASSELPPADSVTYSIRNTLDGNSRTAWNNHSAVVRIGLVNGYAKTAELRAANGRIRGVLITTDARTLRATLSDTASPQRLNRDFGLTRKVTLRVTSIYPGARYTDPALTEIAFWALPG